MSGTESESKHSLSEHFERPSFWNRDRYITGYERYRFLSGVGLIPDDCSSLLDVGCGNGGFLSFVEDGRPSIKAVGVETSKAAIINSWCRSPIQQCGLTALPFEDRRFDIVCSMAVLEHLRDTDVALAVNELMRVSRRYLLLDLPYRERRARIRCVKCNCSFDSQRHLRSYGDSDIAGLFPGFTERNRLVLKGKEAMIPYFLTRILRLDMPSTHFPYAVCPQCGNSLPEPEQRMDAPATTGGLRGRLLRCQPMMQVDREIFVLFERHAV
jgi:SAM-dependent methyltransferase